jgi:Fe-S-cluster containining protein
LRVALTHHDLRRLSDGLGRPAAELCDWLDPTAVDMTGEPGSFVRLASGRRLMVLAQTEGACRLLQPDQRCGAYAQRPLDCRLYPFDLERDEQRRVVRLSRLDPDGCGDERGAAADLTLLTALDTQRWQELEDYQRLLGRWNRLAQHRVRFRLRTGHAADFLAFLGFDPAPSPQPPCASSSAFHPPPSTLRANLRAHVVHVPAVEALDAFLEADARLVVE